MKEDEIIAFLKYPWTSRKIVNILMSTFFYFFVITWPCFYTATEGMAHLMWSVDLMVVFCRDWMTSVARSQRFCGSAPGR